MSGKRVEFSGGMARIHGERHSCVNPAFRRGASIPAICKLGSLTRFAVRDAAHVRGHGHVIWGTAGHSRTVVARFRGGTARALIIRVDRRLARTLEEPPFNLFVVEVPRSAASGPVTVRGSPSARSAPARDPS